MKHYGLIGEKLGHSYSKTLHALLADYSYELLALAPDALEGFLRSRTLDGFNVTIPYKQAVMPYCAELSETARRIGSVNTVVRRADGSLYGDNTDAYGFAMMAKRAGIDFTGRKTLVLGSGGTGLTACDAVRSAGGTPVVISRHGENRYDNLEKHADAAFVVNATPVGMHPNTDASPVDLRRLPQLRGVLDVIYNPLRTRLLLQAAELGIPCACGLGMLVYQAVRACELFTGEAVAPERAEGAEAALRKAALNLVLVGMPGCGKSTVGRELKRLTGMPLADIDAEIERAAGKSIPAIFQAEGEAGFRAREAEQLARFAAGNGQIIVTGGGAVLSAANRERLRCNGYAVHLTRALEQLSTKGRPLSQSAERLSEMQREREPLYAACADATVANQTTPAECARVILEGFDEALCAQRAEP